MNTAKFCNHCGRGYVTDHRCTQIAPTLPPAWEVIAKIFTQELCEEGCEWCVDTPDPYGTGDTNFVQGECTVMTPGNCPKFKEYTEESS